ncbi:MAG TPA: hypothetical protein VM656_00705 [Pyrinomonadaceae bacterium]|nr:hypothetical protein [Pyrinomonadaceae bacterium]
MVFFQDRFCSAAVGQWGNITPLALLAQQFVNEGFVNAKHPSDPAFGGVASFYGINDSFSKV